MSGEDDRELAALIVREQRGFRFILYAGLLMLLILLGMSAALGFYYYRASQDIELVVARQQFDTRRDITSQNNRLANQELRLRRIHAELRGGGTNRFAGAMTPALMASAVASARTFLERGRISFAQEQLIEAAAHSEGEPSPTRTFLAGAAELVQFERSGGTIPPRAAALPQSLLNAQAAFETIAQDAEIGPLAHMGLAFVRFFEAQRTAYDADACESLFQAVSASSAGGQPAAQPLYWQAQCERKLGDTVSSLLHYSESLQQAAPESRSATADAADLALAMNAFHGVGTTLIALYDADENEVASALAVAERECQGEAEAVSPRMQLAERCLREAMALRRRLGQTESQVSGTGENLSFVYLRDADFARALDNAVSVEATGIFAWTELVRALAASPAHAADNESARPIAAQARRRVSFFNVSEFNLCELQALLSAGLYAEAVRIIEREHPGETVACEAAGGAGPTQTR